MAKLLLIGGAGYVGGSIAAHFIDRGDEVWILDNLSTGYRDRVLTPHFVLGSVHDRSLLRQLFRDHTFDAVFDFAAYTLVSESVTHPDKYFHNNTEGTRILVEEMLAAGCRRLIFSSTCAVYGDPGTPLITENSPRKPLSPYGESKLRAERIISAATEKQGLQAVVLRYFNAAGAEPRLRTGECHWPETHLIPNVLKALRDQTPIQLFGSDYPTQDGTCIRDYVHVNDLAQAHWAALELLQKAPLTQGCYRDFVLGSENGYSVREVIRTCEAVTELKTEIQEHPRRAGDPPRLVADASLAKRTLNFRAHERSLTQIVTDAWGWLSKGRKAVFLDRDGTLNIDPGYLDSPSKIQLIPGVELALQKLSQAGFALYVVSNQSGVGRGLFTVETLDLIHRRFDELLLPWGVKMAGYLCCLHRPDENCDCRKPNPRLLEQASRQQVIRLDRSYMVGDKLIDLQAGLNARCKGVALVRTGEGTESERHLGPLTPFIGDSLPEVAAWIVSQPDL